MCLDDSPRCLGSSARGHRMGESSRFLVSHMVLKGRLPVMASSKFLMRRSGLWVIVAAAGLVIAGGCGSGGYSGPTGTVRGTVTINGQPVPSGTGVAFLSDDGFTASGQVGPDGSYQLSSAGSGNQIPAVAYKVMVSAPVTGGVSADDADYEAMMEASASGAGQPAPAAQAAVPPKYNSTATSGLSFTVTAGENTINIELE
jgi:hypothetical protein